MCCSRRWQKPACKKRTTGGILIFAALAPCLTQDTVSAAVPTHLGRASKLKQVETLPAGLQAWGSSGSFATLRALLIFATQLLSLVTQGLATSKTRLSTSSNVVYVLRVVVNGIRMPTKESMHMR